MTPAQYLDRHRGQLARELRELVRIPTVNPPGEHYDEITRLLARKLERLGLATRRYTVPKALLRNLLQPDQWRFGRYNVLGKWRVDRGRPTVHFNAHYDVVPAGGRWRHGSPFSGTTSHGWVYGRGTADMKGSIASLLLALEALRATGRKPRMNVEVSFTADEETDSALGTGWLVKHAPVNPDFAVVMEGGEGDSICCGHNGVVWLRVIVHGRAAHGSQPEAGVNALEKMAQLIMALEPYKRQLARCRFRSPEGRIMMPTVNIGGVFAAAPGGKINTVPAEGWFSIDRRVLPVENHARAEAGLRQFLAAAARRIPKCRITIEKVSENFPCYHKPAGPFFDAIAGALRRVRRRPPVFTVSSGFNDMYFFASERKIPTVGYGPGGRDYHGVDERASLRELTATAKVYAELLTHDAAADHVNGDRGE